MWGRGGGAGERHVQNYVHKGGEGWRDVRWREWGEVCKGGEGVDECGGMRWRGIWGKMKGVGKEEREVGKRRGG
jgi:hypothetical protein